MAARLTRNTVAEQAPRAQRTARVEGRTPPTPTPHIRTPLMLTANQQRFVERYLVHLNASRAARESGCAP